MKRILLVGNPNVGKSVVFSRLTGIGVIASNYPGTTVEYCRGCVGSGEDKMDVVDTPGTYSLEPTSPAEEVAVGMLADAVEKKDCVVINVVDATNLERNLNLTLQLLKKKIPVVVALNMSDEARHTGITIDHRQLAEILGVPVVPTVAVTGEGVKELIANVGNARLSEYRYEEPERWHEVGNIIGRVQTIKHKHHTVFERISDLTIQPWTGIPVAGLVLFGVFGLVRLIGEGLINLILDPFFEKAWRPAVEALSSLLGGGGIIHKVLIGELVAGRIDYRQSFGILTTGLYVEFAQVLPYVFAFYLSLSFLEDSGYLPRLAVIVDKLMHAVGLHGMAIIPMLLGFGCNVPGVLSVRVLESRRERFIAATLMSICVPCMALTAMIFGLVGKYGARGLAPVYLTLGTVWLAGGVLMNLLIGGESPEIFAEIPPYRLPYAGVLAKKIMIRIRWFLKDATPFVLLGVLIVNFLYSLGVIAFLGRIAGPLVTPVLGLPSEALAALLVGFLRKDIAVGMLVPLGLSAKQLVIACVVLATYFPCVASFAVMLKELGIVDLLKATAIMTVTAFGVGALLNLIL